MVRCPILHKRTGTGKIDSRNLSQFFSRSVGMAHRYEIVEGQGPGKWEMLKAIGDGEIINLTVDAREFATNPKISIHLMVRVDDLGTEFSQQPRNSWLINKGLLKRHGQLEWVKFLGYYNTKTRSGWIEVDQPIAS